MGFETTDEILADELEKQRRKLNTITSTLEQQHQMLRLIVQVGQFSPAIPPIFFIAVIKIYSKSHI